MLDRDKREPRISEGSVDRGGEGMVEQSKSSPSGLGGRERWVAGVGLAIPFLSFSGPGPSAYGVVLLLSARLLTGRPHRQDTLGKFLIIS